MSGSVIRSGNSFWSRSVASRTSSAAQIDGQEQRSRGSIQRGGRIAKTAAPAATSTTVSPANPARHDSPLHAAASARETRSAARPRSAARSAEAAMASVIIGDPSRRSASRACSIATRWPAMAGAGRLADDDREHASMSRQRGLRRSTASLQLVELGALLAAAVAEVLVERRERRVVRRVAAQQIVERPTSLSRLSQCGAARPTHRQRARAPSRSSRARVPTAIARPARSRANTSLRAPRARRSGRRPERSGGELVASFEREGDHRSAAAVGAGTPRCVSAPTATPSPATA